MLISVVIPTFNREAQVCRAVSSVLRQTYRDFEVIVVDDGSTDNTERAVRSLSADVHYVSQERRGVSAARNQGIREARGDVVAFLDSDNAWLPKHLATVLAPLQQDVALVSTSPRLVIRRGKPRRAVVFDALPLALVENFVGYTSGIAVRRDDIQAAGGFCETMTAMEDADMWIRLALLRRFAFVEGRTFIRGRAPDSLTARGTTEALYPSESVLLAERAEAAIARSSRPDKEALISRAQGRREWALALAAISSGEGARARDHLRDACSRLPELSHESRLVTRRVSLLAEEDEARYTCFSLAAAAWPRRNAPAARALRRAATRTAARTRRPARVARAVSVELAALRSLTQ